MTAAAVVSWPVRKTAEATIFGIAVFEASAEIAVGLAVGAWALGRSVVNPRERVARDGDYWTDDTWSDDTRAAVIEEIPERRGEHEDWEHELPAMGATYATDVLEDAAVSDEAVAELRPVEP